MNKLIARLIDCGMTRDVALHMYGVYKRKGKLDEFARAIDGREQSEILPVMDELMSTLNVIQPRLYDAVMNKLA